MTTSVEAGIDECRARATFNGARWSWSPYNNRVGTSMRGSTSRRSASADARAMVVKPAGWNWATDRANSAVRSPGAVVENMVGSSAAANCAGG